MKRFILGILFIIFFLFTYPAHAQEAWKITNIDSNISIHESGEVRVQETIRVDFGNIEKHGIYRDIPVVYTNEDGTKYHTKISDISVTRHEYKVLNEGDYVRIRIGDPDVTVNGKQQYDISYTATGVLQGFENYDELYWNSTGNYWDVPIEQATSTVSLKGGEITEANCFVGVVGSTQTCTSQLGKQGSTTFSTNSSLSPGEGMTFVVQYPKGITQLPVVKSFGERLVAPGAIATFIFSLFIGIAGILVLWSQKGRDLWYRGTHLFDKNAREETRPIFHRDSLVVEYIPPEKLRPAEVGVLVDERADTLDVTSTIIDLATRGHLTISEQKKKWAFGSTDYTLTKKTKKTSDLLKYENELYTRLFDTGDTVKMSELKKEFYNDLKKVKDQLYADMVEKGFFPSNPENVRTLYLGAAIVLAVIFGIITFFGLERELEYIFVIGIAGVITGLNLLLVSRFMSRRTGKGYEMYRRIRGYRMFIENVEEHRQKFFESKNMFNTVLPYAIVFGLTAKFAKAMQDMGVKPDATTASWYHGYHAFNVSSFNSSMNNFSQSMGAAMAATPSSTGGSSGGGFSGGGFGGGGGGSW